MIVVPGEHVGIGDLANRSIPQRHVDAQHRPELMLDAGFERPLPFRLDVRAASLALVRERRQLLRLRR